VTPPFSTLYCFAEDHGEYSSDFLSTFLLSYNLFSRSGPAPKSCPNAVVWSFTPLRKKILKDHLTWKVSIKPGGLPRRLPKWLHRLSQYSQSRLPKPFPPYLFVGAVETVGKHGLGRVPPGFPLRFTAVCMYCFSSFCVLAPPPCHLPETMPNFSPFPTPWYSCPLSLTFFVSFSWVCDPVNSRISQRNRCGVRRF